MICANAKISLILWVLWGSFLIPFTLFPPECGFNFPDKYTSLVEHYEQDFVPWPVVTYSVLLWLRILKELEQWFRKLLTTKLPAPMLVSSFLV